MLVLSSSASCFRVRHLQLWEGLMVLKGWALRGRSPVLCVCLPMGPMATFSLLPFALVGLQPSLEGPHPDISLPGCQDPPPWLGASFGVAMNKLKRGQRRACVG